MVLRWSRQKKATEAKGLDAMWQVVVAAETGKIEGKFLQEAKEKE